MMKVRIDDLAEGRRLADGDPLRVLGLFGRAGPAGGSRSSRLPFAGLDGRGGPPPGSRWHPLKPVQGCFPLPVPVPLHVSQALLWTTSEQLARESHGRRIAAIVPG
jgi:hypothetical protein